MAESMPAGPPADSTPVCLSSLHPTRWGCISPGPQPDQAPTGLERSLLPSTPSLGKDEHVTKLGPWLPGSGGEEMTGPRCHWVSPAPCSPAEPGLGCSPHAPRAGTILDSLTGRARGGPASSPIRKMGKRHLSQKVARGSTWVTPTTRLENYKRGSEDRAVLNPGALSPVRTPRGCGLVPSQLHPGFQGRLLSALTFLPLRMLPPLGNTGHGRPHFQALPAPNPGCSQQPLPVARWDRSSDRTPRGAGSGDGPQGRRRGARVQTHIRPQTCALCPAGPVSLSLYDRSLVFQSLLDDWGIFCNNIFFAYYT